MRNELQTNPSPRARTRKAPSLLIVSGLCLLTLPGCVYFRFDEKSLGELKNAQEEQAEVNQLLFKPGTIFYSR
jgi:hypothetical protein